MGIPEGAMALLAEAFKDLSVVIETRWGTSPPVNPDRDYVEGLCSASELSMPAQASILCPRAASLAFSTTSHGRRVHSAGFVDDTENYGSGIRDLIDIMKELIFGSIAKGI